MHRFNTDADYQHAHDSKGPLQAEEHVTQNESKVIAITK